MTAKYILLIYFRTLSFTSHFVALQMGARRDGPHRARVRPPDAQRVFLLGDLLGLEGVAE